MKSIFLVSAIILLTACSSLQSVNLTPNQIQNQISNSGIVDVGNEVKVYTSTGKTHQFVVTDITPTELKGSGIRGLAVLVFLNYAGNGIKNSSIGSGVFGVP